MPDLENLATTYQGGYDVWAWETRCNICLERLGLNPDGTPWAGPAGSFAWVVVCATKPRGHAFHKECIQRYQRTALAQGNQYAECPECRAPVINVGGPEGVPLPPAAPPAVPSPPAADVVIDHGPAIPPIRRALAMQYDPPEYEPRYNVGSEGSRTIEYAIQAVVDRAPAGRNYDDDGLLARVHNAGPARLMWATTEGQVLEALGLPTAYFDAIFDYWLFYRAERDPSTPDAGMLTMNHFTRPIAWGGVVTIAAAVQSLGGDTADVLYAVAELFGRAHPYYERAAFDAIFLFLCVRWRERNVEAQRQNQGAPPPGLLSFAGMEDMVREIEEDGNPFIETYALRQSAIFRPI